MPTERLITVESSFPHKETVQRLEAAVNEGHDSLCARRSLRRRSRSGFGLATHPSTHLWESKSRHILLMQDNQKIGIDLPLRALIWQDGDDRTWVSYIEPAEIAKQFGIINREDLLAKMGQSVRLAVERATKA
jgi:hypothetical protein